MGVYRWYLLFSLMVFSALSHAADCPAGIKIPSGTYGPVINGVLGSDIPFSINIHGCEYAPVDINYFIYTEGPLKGSIYSANGFISTGHIIKTDDKPDAGDGDDSGGDTGGDTGGDSTPPTEPDNPGVTPPVNPPVKPPVNPDSSSVSQLYQQYNNCSIQLSHFPMPDYSDYNPSIDYQYNAQVRQCNSVLDRLTSMINSGSVNGGTDDNHDFITGDGIGNFYKCRRNPHTPQEWADQGKLYPGPVLGTQLVKNREREIGFDCQIIDGKNKCDWHLNFNYVTDNGRGTSVCNSVYLSSGDSDSGSQGDGNGDDTGHGDSGSSDGDTGTGDQGGADVSLPSLDVPELTLSPLWDIWPSARDFKLTLPAAKCPVFNIEVFGTNHQIDTFCTIFTPDIIAIIRAICILTASILSFIIVLRS
ncbi:hypothetical protein GF271_00015 [Salmonella enterica subsp. enterica serovar Newport]|nr:hypothetical protein [Salmonella enterica subsp. enterica serovar Newport]